MNIATLYRECETALLQGNWETARDRLERLLELIHHAGDDAAAAAMHLRAAEVCQHLGTLDDGIAHCRRAQELACQLHDKRLQAAALHRQGHLVRLRDPQAARRLFQSSLSVGADDAEGDALSLAMIGQIDFTAGDERGGLDAMLCALAGLPSVSPAFEHLVEHIQFFGSRIARSDFARLVAGGVQDAVLRERLLGPRGH